MKINRSYRALQQAKEWVLVVSASVSMLSIAVGIWQTLSDYQLKLRAEERLALSSQAETDIRLLQAFNEVVLYASGDREKQISEKTIELLFQEGFISKSELSDPKKLNEKLGDAAFFGDPVGYSLAITSTAAMAELAARYPILREGAIIAMDREIVRENSPEAVDRYLEVLRRLEPNQSLKSIAEGFDH